MLNYNYFCLKVNKNIENVCINFIYAIDFGVIYFLLYIL